MAKRRIAQTMSHDNPGTLGFWCQRSQQNSNGGTPNGGTKCRWGMLKLATFDKTRCNSKTLTVASIVNLVWSQVYHSERPPLFAAYLPWCITSRGFISDSWYLLLFIRLQTVYILLFFISDIAIFVLKRDVKLQLTYPVIWEQKTGFKFWLHKFFFTFLYKV